MAESNPLSDQHHELISSARVEGTPVYSTEGKKLGTVHSLMINKVSGQVVYAAIVFGGFLHLRERVLPVAWSDLTYDVGREGYVVGLTSEQIETARSVPIADAERLNDPRKGWALI